MTHHVYCLLFPFPSPRRNGIQHSTGPNRPRRMWSAACRAEPPTSCRGVHGRSIATRRDVPRRAGGARAGTAFFCPSWTITPHKSFDSFCFALVPCRRSFGLVLAVGWTRRVAAAEVTRTDRQAAASLVGKVVGLDRPIWGGRARRAHARRTTGRGPGGLQRRLCTLVEWRTGAVLLLQQQKKKRGGNQQFVAKGIFKKGAAAARSRGHAWPLVGPGRCSGLKRRHMGTDGRVVDPLAGGRWIRTN